MEKSLDSATLYSAFEVFLVKYRKVCYHLVGIMSTFMGNIMQKLIILVWLTALILAACGDDQADNEEDTSDYRALLRANVIDPPHPIDDFTLASTTNTDFTLSQQAGKVSVFYFGYTTCPDICPTTLFELQKAYLELGQPADRLNIIMVTVDPARDTIDRLGPYVEFQGHADFIGLYGTDEELAPVLDAFDVLAVQVDASDSAVGYLMDHTADLFVVTPDGQLIARFIHGVTASTMVHDLRLILENES